MDGNDAAEKDTLRSTVAVVGLGYVGLPLALAFGRHRKTIGFDLDEAKLARLAVGIDPIGEVSPHRFESAGHLRFTSDASQLASADIIIVAVPTPIDEARRPDLDPIRDACRLIGSNMGRGATIVFESTVYPGCTEEVCVPILEDQSGLKWNAGVDEITAAGFNVGYSPERINPGDSEHQLEDIVKVVSGDTTATLDLLCDLYEEVIRAGVYRAPSIKVAEAAKVIENTQRDLNIALMNELAMIFNALDIDTIDVLETAGTKWNFLPFRPGLVGGHCIGVDPYYLTYKAQSVGFHPQVVLGGRQTNDGVGKFIAEQTVKQLAVLGQPVSGARVTVLGVTFKEDCADIRNSKVVDVVSELRRYHCEVSVHDPIANGQETTEEFGIQLVDLDSLSASHAVILAVAHRQYLELGAKGVLGLLAEGGVVIDVKSVLDRSEIESSGATIWRL